MHTEFKGAYPYTELLKGAYLIRCSGTDLNTDFIMAADGTALLCWQLCFLNGAFKVSVQPYSDKL